LRGASMRVRNKKKKRKRDRRHGIGRRFVHFKHHKH
jgi:hypothetical protein